MDRGVVLSKISSLSRCIDRIDEKRPGNVDILMNDLDLQDIISVNLERSIQICVDIASFIISEKGGDVPITMGDSFIKLAGLGIIDKALSVRLAKAVGFRNISVHEYRKIDWNIVYEIITKNIDDFRKFAEEILKI